MLSIGAFQATVCPTVRLLEKGDMTIPFAQVPVSRE
jgi:hypothetical protein